LLKQNCNLLFIWLSKLPRLNGFTKVAESMVVANKNSPSSSSSAIVCSVVAADQQTVFESATKFAKQPTALLVKQLNSLIKKNTGIIYQALMIGLKDQSEEW
jgi:hypothetical protein